MPTGESLLLVVALGMTREYLSSRDDFLGSGVNLGKSEIDRLMGDGDWYGHGPLPTFLRVATDAARSGSRCRVVFCRCGRRPSDSVSAGELKRFGDYGIPGSVGAEFGEPIRSLAVGTGLLETSGGSPSVDELRSVLAPWCGNPDVTCLVVGSRTEIEVLQTAARVRRDLGFPRVLVCPHLTGSRDVHARSAALRGNLPDALVTTVSDLPPLMQEFGLFCEEEVVKRAVGCRIDPPEVLEGLSPTLREAYRMMISQLFPLHETVHLKRLSGGFSGCGLFLATSECRGAKDAVSIVKIGPKGLIDRELHGYHQVKSRMGPHVPTIQFPVREGALGGIVMELASMAGSPETLQHCFETIYTGAGFPRFLKRLETALRLLRKNLYGGRIRRLAIHPYFEFGLQSKQQEVWLEENIRAIVPGFQRSDERIDLGREVAVSNPLPAFQALTRHSDRLPAGIALCHGDLNLANILFDDHDNLWLIDCSYSAERPVETDFAKLENDLTLVLVKEFVEADLPLVARFLTFLYSGFSLPAVDQLSDDLLFIATDSRFEKIYRSVRVIREAYATIPQSGDDLLYRVAQLKYAVHTLSFDQRRNRGECSVVQLKMALLATVFLLERLDKHPFHRQCAKDRPDDYPERFPVPRECASWSEAFSGYAPSNAETDNVLAQDPARNPSGKADPADPRLIPDLGNRQSLAGSYGVDSAGRPLNPRGRTGLAGRGFFWRWGPNLAVDPVATRVNPQNGKLEFLLVKRCDSLQWGIPGGLVGTGEPPIEAARRSLLEKTGVKADQSDIREIARGIMDDYRNTDHAWVETIAFHLHLPPGPQSVPNERRANKQIVDAAWMSITPELVRFLFANHAWLIRETLEILMKRPPADCTQETLRALLEAL